MMVVTFKPSVVFLISLSFLVIGIAFARISSINRQFGIQSTLYPNYLDMTVCRTIPGLTKAQMELCFQQPDTTLIAMQGLNQAVQECQYQFKGHRWNCSSLATRGQNPYISAIFQKGYRESAFAYAIASAGVAIAVARGCSTGNLANCGCDGKSYKIRQPRTATSTTTTVTVPSANAWKWGGCSHNLNYGVKFSKLFLDSREKAEDIHSKINLHNNQVGRKAVSNNMQIKCKCHGMSGSCELKTCWRATPDFRIVGKALKERFKSAVLIDQNNLSEKMLRKFNAINQKKRKQQKSNHNKPRQWAKKNKRKRDLSYDLLYYQKSPNYCDQDQLQDIPGTFGRICNRTSTGVDSCATLCCGRGYNFKKERTKERCKCKFHWCCKVDCQICIVEKWITVCK